MAFSPAAIFTNTIMSSPPDRAAITGRTVVIPISTIYSASTRALFSRQLN
ncbi:MAG: hypothetical protein LBT81_04265 [Helicobacteraceae bacterium]|nr:hypothetical protein [Helicobacteraceae bacterium]